MAVHSEPIVGTSAPPALGRRAVVRRLAAGALLAICLLTVLLAVPDLRPVVHEVREMDPALVLAALGLELASCLSFVTVFRLFFPAIPRRPARELAWTQMGSGALLPGGGIGSLAAGGWLLHLAGMPGREIVRRSSGLFFLTSAINVLVLGLAGALLLLQGPDGAKGVLLGGLPVLTAVTAVAGTLCLPPLARRIGAGHPRAGWIEALGQGIPDARQAITRPSWGLLGATGYLLLDIAVLWVCLAAVGPAPPAAALVVAYLVGYLANAVPVPGGVGVLDVGLVGALALYGLPLDHAAAGVLVYHAIAFWIPAIGGTVAYGRLRHGDLPSAAAGSLTILREVREPDVSSPRTPPGAPSWNTASAGRAHARNSAG
ncbi:MAG TPA: lysylphosphatidylglycerol synthase transmembrane domain-containing protein [Solirubrobacteraceae bacterium]|nr:lysylphosphatidylglycerol synthase transmembrane domain-containing protein [Solirubrobacteraceae bacterium]